MPIYEYRCAACGFQREYLQKMTDPLLTDCPECGKAKFKKMVTAAGFQLKGSGWYATDFKHPAKSKSKPEDGAGAKSDDKAATKTESQSAAKSDAKSAPEAATKKSDAAASPVTSGASPAS